MLNHASLKSRAVSSHPVILNVMSLIAASVSIAKFELER